MARTKSLVNTNTKKLAMKGAGGIVGLYGSSMLTRNISFLNQNALVAGLIKFAGGIFLTAASKNDFMQGVGGGVSIEGGAQATGAALKKWAPSTAAKLGIGTVMLDRVHRVNGPMAERKYSEASMVQ